MSSSPQLDVLFSGPLLFVPTVNGGNIAAVEVYSPSNAHSMGAVFLPGEFFSDAELNDPQCERWPVPESFSLLDAHSYAIEITQRPPQKSEKPLPVSAIPDSNHKVRPGRKLSHHWEVAISVNGRISGWGSHRISRVTEDLYVGGDAPTTPTTAAMHRLTYTGVTGADFPGASGQARKYLQANITSGGTLIVMGEVPYQPSLHHERQAVAALARLAGLDLHLAATEPNPHQSRLMHHTGNCAYSIVLV